MLAAAARDIATRRNLLLFLLAFLLYNDGIQTVILMAAVYGKADLGLDTGAFEDGQHIVGDDSNIVVTASGDVHIAYQDATSGTLRYAVGTPGGTGHVWTRKAIEQDGFAGFFPTQVTVNSATMVVNWWRKGGTKVEGDVRVLSP